MCDPLRILAPEEGVEVEEEKISLDNPLYKDVIKKEEKQIVLKQEEIKKKPFSQIVPLESKITKKESLVDKYERISTRKTTRKDFPLKTLSRPPALEEPFKKKKQNVLSSLEERKKYKKSITTRRSRYK